MAYEAIRCDIWISDTLVEPNYADPEADANWDIYGWLTATSLTRGASPTLEQGQFYLDYGTKSDEYTIFHGGDALDVADTNAHYSYPYDLVGKFARFEVPAHDFEWFGLIVAVDESRGPEETYDDGVNPPEQRITVGRQTWSVVGVQYYLMRQFVNWSMIKATPDNVRIERAIGFNTGSGAGRSAAQEKRGNMAPGGGAFSSDPDTAEEWTATKAVEYLLSVHGPKTALGAFAPVEFTLADDAADYLDWFKPSLETAGQSVYQIINSIIAPERGLAWRIELDRGPLQNEFKFVVRVTSLAPADVALPGGVTLPETLRPLALAPADIDGPEATVRTNRDSTRKWSRIIRRAARRRAVATLSITAGNLEIGWRGADETDYKTGLGADPKANDKYRQGDRFGAVYKTFKVPNAWPGTAGDGTASPTEFVMPKVEPSTGSIVGAEPVCMPGLRMLRTLPIQAGWDYSDATAPTPRDPAATAPEWQKPFVIIDVGTAEAADWRFGHQINATAAAGGKKTGYWLHVLDSCSGFQLTPSGGMPHALAKGHFDAGSPGASDHQTEVNFATSMRATVGFEWDAYCEGQYPAADAADEPLDTLYIQIGERARWDHVPEGTVFDVENGVPKKVTNGGFNRDDRDLCKQIAQIAFQWYGEERAEVSLTFNGATLPVDVLDFITTIGSGAVDETVNALVSQITHDFTSGAVSVSAGFQELDFTRLA